MRCVVLAAALFAMGCGTVLAISDDPAADPPSDPADAGYTRLSDGALVGPDGEVIVPEAATDAADAAVDTGNADAASNCMVKATPCSGPTLLTQNRFDVLNPSGWGASSMPPELDGTDFVSAQYSLKATLADMAPGPTKLSVSVPSSPPNVCLEVCMKIGAISGTPIVVLRLANVGTNPVTTASAEVRAGAGADDVRIESGVATPINGGLPRNRWFHLKLELEYVGAGYKLWIDAVEQPVHGLGPRPASPAVLLLDVGLTGSAGHGPATARYDDLLMTGAP